MTNANRTITNSAMMKVEFMSSQQHRIQPRKDSVIERVREGLPDSQKTLFSTGRMRQFSLVERIEHPMR